MKPATIKVRFTLSNGAEVVEERRLQELPDGRIGLPDEIQIVCSRLSPQHFLATVFKRVEYNPVADELRYREVVSARVRR